jgi:hypothetical protein
MSQYPVPPPSYGSTSPSPKSPNSQLHAGARYQDMPGPSAGIYNQPAPGDLPDDFKVHSLYPFTSHPFDLLSQYGVTVTESSVEIRNAFVRKVYTILCASLTNTLIDGADVPVLCCSCSNREFSRMFICLDLT